METNLNTSDNAQREKTAKEILFEYGINLLNFQDDFNCQLLAAMEVYKNANSKKGSQVVDTTGGE